MSTYEVAITIHHHMTWRALSKRPYLLLHVEQCACRLTLAGRGAAILPVARPGANFERYSDVVDLAPAA
jgi:hypothetical protein